ncbi:hypothetical protein Baya_16277 [Bagarius yarrelli]|uniref:C-type lectin domain-containing protein n=1 Tax=Bagarius yarrelli TaxID=175774 RepID=A0A556VUV6_BAGYA|nr:hypothetical protein Baya_16277 [Bagarius yarrelli]
MAVLSILLLLILTGSTTSLFRKEHKFVGQSMIWTDAQEHCTQILRYEGFSVIDSQSAYDNLRHQISSGDGWIGLTKQPLEAEFTKWSDGKVLEFLMWKTVNLTI